MATIVKTYQENIYTGHMVHDGYFVLVDDTPLKWISIEELEALPNANDMTAPNWRQLAEEVRTV